MAISFTKFVKRFTQIVAAFGLTAALASVSMAATANWVGTAASTNANKWGTSTAYNSNWAPAGATNSTTDAEFGAATGHYTLAVVQSVTAQSMTFTGAAGDAYTLNGPSTITLANGKSGGLAIVNDSANNVTISAPVTLSGTATTMKIGGSGAGALSLATVTIGSKTLELTDSSSVSVSNLNSSGGSVTVQSGALSIGAGTGTVAAYTVTGGSLGLGDPAGLPTASSNLLVNGGTYINNGYDRTFTDVTITSGTVSLLAPGDILRTSGNYQQSGGEIAMSVASLTDYSQVVVSGSTVAFAGGGMNLDLTGLATPAKGDSWQLFNKGSSQTNTDGSFNFSSFASSSDNTQLASLGWTKDGQEWKSSAFGDSSGNYFVFTSQNGVLMVVPEPSTYAMGAIGLATAGFFRWRSRRRPEVA